MFLKRFLMTALGALGLGAFAAGTASAQQIPAPDISDDQITCSMNVPSAMVTPTPSVADNGMSPLDTLIGDGMTAIDVTGMGAGTYEDLGYVIQATVANCGATAAGDVYTADTTAFTADANGAIPLNVAEGYTELLTKFEAVYGAPGDAMETGAKGALDDANAALAMGIAMGTTGAALTALEEAVTRAQEAYNKALADFNAVSTDPNNASSLGPIYDAGKAEWMAKAAVTKAVVDYNTQVADTTTAQTALDAMSYADNYLDGATPTDADSLWVPLGNNELFGGSTPVVTIAMGMGTVNLNQLVQYVNGDLSDPQVGMAAVPGMGTGDPNDGAGNTAPVASNTDDSNFTAAGVLIIPMEADATTTDDLTDLRNTTSPAAEATVSAIRTLVENANIAAAELKKARDEFTGLPQTQAIYDEAYRRAQLEADYYNARWAEVQAYSRDTRTAAQKLEYVDTDGSGVIEADERTDSNKQADYQATPISIASRNAALTTEQNKRFLREQELRAAVSTREAATAAVRTAFTDPQDFYDQLVAKRNAAKIAADKAVAEATTPSLTQTTAQENAMKALVEANGRKSTIDSLFDDPNDPTEALVTELLKGDDDGDDGQALVNAISSNYDAVNALTAEDDPDTLEDESGRITQLEDKVSMLTGGDDGSSGLGALEDKVNALTAMDDPETMENENGAVTQNAADISMLDSDLANLEGTVDDNSADLDQVWMDLNGTPRGVEAQHEGLAACEATGTINVANCADARSRHNEAAITDIGTDIDDVNDKLGQKKEYIDNLGAAIGVDPVTGEGTGEDGMSRVDMNAAAIAAEEAARMKGDADEMAARMAADDALGGRIDAEEAARMKGDADEMAARKAADDALGGRIDAEEAARMKGDADEMAARKAADDALGGRIDAEEAARMKGDADEMAARMAADEAEMTARMAADKAEMDARMMADDALGGRIDSEAMARSDADMALGMRIDGEAMARADGDVMLATAIEEAVAAGAAADMALGGRITSNANDIASNMNSIGQNRSMINDNRNMIGELSDDLDVVRAGVAASMALAGMPAINGRGISIGVGSYDGESAFAVGFQIQGEQASFKVGVTSSGGETGASAGVGFNF